MPRVDKVQEPPFLAWLDETSGAGIVLGPGATHPEWERFAGALRTRRWEVVGNGLGEPLNMAHPGRPESVYGLRKITAHPAGSPVKTAAYDVALGVLLGSMSASLAPA